MMFEVVEYVGGIEYDVVDVFDDEYDAEVEAEELNWFELNPDTTYGVREAHADGGEVDEYLLA